MNEHLALCVLTSFRLPCSFESTLYTAYPELRVPFTTLEVST